MIRHGHRRRRGLPDRRAHPGGGRVRGPARRLVRRHAGGAGRARDPLRLRRGADRVGPHRAITSGATRPTASLPTS